MKIVKAVAALIVIALAFGGGYVVRATRTSAGTSNGRTILYYVDPMHPAYKSDKPGVAPDCGMKYLPREVAFGKMQAMAEGAALVRAELNR